MFLPPSEVSKVWERSVFDKKLKQSPGKIIKRFEDLVKSNDGKSLTKEQIKEVGAQLQPSLIFLISFLGEAHAY